MPPPLCWECIILVASGCLHLLSLLPHITVLITLLCWFQMGQITNNPWCQSGKTLERFFLLFRIWNWNLSFAKVLRHLILSVICRNVFIRNYSFNSHTPSWQSFPNSVRLDGKCLWTTILRSDVLCTLLQVCSLTGPLKDRQRLVLKTCQCYVCFGIWSCWKVNLVPSYINSYRGHCFLHSFILYTCPDLSLITILSWLVLWHPLICEYF